MVKGKLRIIWDNEARNSLKSIYDYIKNRESEDVAKKVRGEIVSQVKMLLNFPEKYAREHYLNEEKGDFRYKVVWRYKIIYEITSNAIHVLDIFHTSRDPSNIKLQK
jgi:plasmid stabilization system protein ParE